MKWTRTTKLLLMCAVAGVALFSSRASASGGFVEVTDEMLKSIDPRVKRTGVAGHIARAMSEAGVSGIPRQAAFLAQILHETGGMTWLEELASGRAYEGRADLGNTQPGDGVRFKGRGMIMITGRFNYEKVSQDLGLDLVGQPEIAASPEVAARVAAWFWRTRGLNELADAGKFDSITRKINGGLNGKTERDRLFARAQKVLNGQVVA